MVCPECNGRGETIYYVETDRDENTVTVEQRKGICRTCNGSGLKAQTNADRIRAMSDGELAESLSKTVVDAICYSHSAEKQVDKTPKEIWDDLVKEYLEWLKQPAEE